MEILQKEKDARPNSPIHKSKDLAQDVETYAPGYLDMEKEGRSAEYNLEELLEIFQEDDMLTMKSNEWLNSMKPARDNRAIAVTIKQISIS